MMPTQTKMPAEPLDVRDALYAALLQVAESLGDDLKGLSWFGRNHRREAIKQAA